MALGFKPEWFPILETTTIPTHQTPSGNRILPFSVTLDEVMRSIVVPQGDGSYQVRVELKFRVTPVGGTTGGPEPEALYFTQTYFQAPGGWSEAEREADAIAKAIRQFIAHELAEVMLDPHGIHYVEPHGDNWNAKDQYYDRDRIPEWRNPGYY